MGATSSSPAGGRAPLQRTYTTYGVQRIPDRFRTLEDVQAAIRAAGIESCNLLLAVDFTASNTDQGARSFGGRSLHHLDARLPNPYEQALAIVARTLSSFDEDQLIPCYGFGDVTTHDRAVFSFNPNGAPCKGLEACLTRYREIVPHVKLSGPTSFAPAIYEAMRVVQESGGLFHILVILADGAITRSSALAPGQWSQQEVDTMEAIRRASKLPLSIVIVGLGDGPWDQMETFDDSVERDFDNVQFVNFTTVLERTIQESPDRREACFALNALMELPDQYAAIGKLNLIGRRVEDQRPPQWRRPPLDPPGVPPPSGGIAGPSPAIFAAQNARLATEQTGPVDPVWFECPISKEIMEDPVIAADGHTYERREIEAWFASHRTSPMTGARLQSTNLVPNHHLRSQIQSWRATNPQ